MSRREPGEPSPHFSESEYYARQTRLPEIGRAGQDRLRAASVLVVGAGGLGCPALSYLAAAGVGTIGICEADRLEASNLHRQTLYSYTRVDDSKAALAARRIREQNPFVDIQVHGTGLTPENALTLFDSAGLVLDCTDNFAAKFLINDAAVLTRTPAVVASIHYYEGQIIAVDPASGGPCLRCLWPEMPEPDCVGSCAEVGVLGVVPGILGTMQAMEAIKYFTGLRDVLQSTMVLIDCLSYSTRRVSLPKNPECPACGPTPSITSIEHDVYYPSSDINIDLSRFGEETLRRYRVIDIREGEEVRAQPLEGIPHDHHPLSAWDLENPPITPEEYCLITCARGMRSNKLVSELRGAGYARVFSVENGCQAFYQRRNR